MKLSEIIAFFIETSKLFCYLIKVVHNSNIANYSLDKAFRRNYFMHTLWVLIVGAVIGAIAAHLQAKVNQWVGLRISLPV